MKRSEIIELEVERRVSKVEDGGMAVVLVFHEDDMFDMTIVAVLSPERLNALSFRAMCSFTLARNASSNYVLQPCRDCCLVVLVEWPR